MSRAAPGRRFGLPAGPLPGTCGEVINSGRPVAVYDVAMRKSLKRKLRSCALCKPHKMGGAQRWKNRDLQSLREAEKIARRATYR